MNKGSVKLMATFDRMRDSRRGFVLIIVLVYIALAGTLMLITASSTARLVQTGRHGHAAILLGQLIDSGRAWACTRRDLHADTPIILDAADILPGDASGQVSIKISVEPSAPATIVIEAQLRLRDRRFVRAARFTTSLRVP